MHVREKGAVSLIDASSSRGCVGLVERLRASPSQVFVLSQTFYRCTSAEEM